MTVAADTRVRRALERAVELGEVGVQVAAFQRGVPIADDWIGDGIDSDSLFPIFSVTKAVTLTALHLQAERGLVDYEAPVARYWPEFAAHGKDAILVRHVLEHRSGVPHMPAGMDAERMTDWEWMCAGIADLRPLHPPGTKSTYQARSMGWILGEVIRRTDGRDVARFVAEELSGPLGAGDLWLGLPEEHEHRLVPLAGTEYAGATPSELAPGRAAAMPGVTAPQLYASRSLRAAVLPANGGIATARAVARFFSLLASGGEAAGVRLLSEGRVRSFARPRANAYEFDDVIGLVPYVGVGGYWLGGEYPPAEPGVGVGPRILCHPGAGGTIAWADLGRGLAVAILHNRLFQNYPLCSASEHPHTAIGDAVRAVADELRPAGARR